MRKRTAPSGPQDWVKEKATDAQLIAVTQGGEVEAFQELVGRYQHRLFGLCYKLLGRHHDAEDACQETFLRAYRALDRYDPGRPFDRWLLTIAANCCVSMLRRRRPRRELAREGFEGGGANVRGSASPAEEVEARDFVEAAAEAIAHLGEPYRVPFVLFHQEGLAYGEIAQALDLPLGTVKSRVHRARKMLYQRLCKTGFLEKEMP